MGIENDDLRLNELERLIRGQPLQTFVIIQVLFDDLDDFSAWLADFGNDYAGLLSDLAGIDPYFSSLIELRQTLATTFARHFTVPAS